MPRNEQTQEIGAVSATALVLDALRSGTVASQADVVKKTGLGRAAVAERVAKLAAIGLVDSEGSIIRGRGRPSTRVGIRGSAGHVLIASLSATTADVAIADFAGHVVASGSHAIAIGEGPEPILAQLVDAFSRLYERCREDLGTLLGIGVGIPGPVEFRTGRPVAPPIMPGWDAYPIADRLGGHYAVPVWVDSDVNLVTLAEWRLGVARGHANVVYLKIGTGIGVGIVSDGGLRRGEHGAAGDVGHIQVTDDPKVVCRCGNVGCLEPLAGGFAIARQGERAAQDGRSQALAAVLARDGVLSVAAVGEAAASGDAASIEILQRAGRYAGTMLAGVVNLLNPSLVVVGGGVARSGDVFLAAIRESVYRRSLPLATRHLMVSLAALTDRPAITGATSMVLDELCREANLTETLSRVNSAAVGEVA